jgi:hypothetical protein
MQELNKQVIAKYAELAENLLQRYYPNDFTAVTIEKLACALIDEDLTNAERLDDQDYSKQASAIMTTAFYDELAKLRERD